MTAICRGGTSSLNAGLPEVVIATAATVEAVLSAASLGVLIPLSALVGIFSYHALTGCGADPPGFAPMSAAELDVLANFQVLDALFATALNKLSQNIVTAMWLTYCHCDDGLPNTLGAPWAPPAGAPSGALPPGAPCRDVASVVIPMGGANRTNLYGSGNDPNNQLGLQAGETFVQMECWITANGASHANGTFQMSFDTPTGVEIGPAIEPSGHALSGGAHVFFGETVTPTAGALEVGYVTDGSVGTTDIVQGIAHIYCAGATPANPPTGTTCTDPAVGVLLNQILALVTVIQRQAAPFAYVHGAAHAGISGVGVLALQGVLGVQITPTALPPAYGLVEGDPDVLWLDSWINWGNADGWTKREFLTASPYVSLPPLAGQFTAVGYSLKPGLTVTVTELRREP